MLALQTVCSTCFNLPRVFVYSITESEIAPLKSQLEELDTEITEMVRLKVVLIKLHSIREQVSLGFHFEVFSVVAKQHRVHAIFWLAFKKKETVLSLHLGEVPYPLGALGLCGVVKSFSHSRDLAPWEALLLLFNL